MSIEYNKNKENLSNFNTLNSNPVFDKDIKDFSSISNVYNSKCQMISKIKFIKR